MNAFAPTPLSGGAPVAALRLGATLYFVEPIAELAPQLAHAWTELHARGWVPEPATLRSSRDLEPRRGCDAAAVAAELRAAASAQSLYSLHAHDGAALPERAFELRLVPAFGEWPRASYLRVLLPAAAGHEALLALTAALAEQLPVWHGSAGPVFTYLPAARPLAFDQIWAWARRFWGPGISYPPAETWDAAEHLGSLNWLVLISDAFRAAQLPELEPERLPEREGVRAERRGSGWILRAGREPRLGDLHRFERLPEYTALAQRLEPALIAEPSALPGMFQSQGCTLAWQRRFLDPRGWREPQLA